MKKRVILAALAALFLLSACSAVEAETEMTPVETAPSAQQTAAAAEAPQPVDENSGKANESEDTAESEDAAGTEDEYGIMTLPLYISLSVTDIIDGIATVQIDNHSGYEIEYDLRYALEREVQPDEWERLESEEDILVADESYSLPDLQQATVLCDLNAYGDLPNGHYRIEKDDIYAEFTLQDGALVQE